MSCTICPPSLCGSFFSYETLKMQIEHLNELRGLPHHISHFERLVCGGIAGLIAQSATYVPVCHNVILARKPLLALSFGLAGSCDTGIP